MGMSNTTKERAMILHPPATPTTQLSYDPTTQTYVGEISSTNGFGRVYDDACDVGLTLVSARTGNEIVFVVNGTDRDIEGDITAWTLVPADPQAVRHAYNGAGHTDASKFTVRLFND